MSRSIQSASSAVSSGSRMTNDPYKNQFDEWAFIKRRGMDNSFCMTSKFRMNHQKIRRIKSALIRRNRKCAHDQGDVDKSENSSSTSGENSNQDLDDPEEEDFFDIFEALNSKTDFRRLFSSSIPSLPNSRPVSGAEYGIIEDLSENGTPAQKLYLKKCAEFQITPSAYFAKRLSAFAIEIPHLNLGPKGAEACAVAMTKTNTVHILNMTDNNIGPHGAKFISALLREKVNITDVNLSENGLGSVGCRSILKVVFDLDKIVRLDLSGNGLKDNDAESIREMIEDARHLRYLNLSHNQFREKGGQSFGKAIGWNEGLHEIDLSWNHFRRSGAIGIAQCLEENTCLKVLKVSWNGFYLEGCKTLAQTLPLNTTLTELDLTSNRINRECLEKLMKGLAKNYTLQILRLACNPITSAGAYDILKFISETPKSGIRKLDLGKQTVEEPFVRLLAELEIQRNFTAIYGSVQGQEAIAVDEYERELMNENPAIVLIEFSQMMGFRMVDLFNTLDKDGSKSLTKQEIAKGLLNANIPLSNKSLVKLIRKLDLDGDGEISYGELLVAQQEHRKMAARLMLALEEKDDFKIENTDIWRIRLKLQSLMSTRMAEHPSFIRQSQAIREVQEGIELRKMESLNGSNAKYLNGRQELLTHNLAKAAEVPAISSSGTTLSVQVDTQTHGQENETSSHIPI